MRNFIITLSCFFTITAAFSQVVIPGQIVDDANKPVAHALIHINGTNTNIHSDSDGYFAIKIIDTAYITVTCLGFKNKVIILKNTDTSTTIELQKDNFLLTDVPIVNKRDIGRLAVLGKKKLHQQNKSSNNSAFEEGLLLKTKHKNGILKEVYVFITSDNTPSADFKIHVYKADSAPIISLITCDVIAHATKGNEWVRVDLSDKHIALNEGVYIAVEWISSGNEAQVIGLTRNYSSKTFSYNRNMITNEHYNLHGYSPMIYCTYTY